MAPWRYIELGGSSAQTSTRDPAGRFWFSPGIIHDATTPIALACPGLVQPGRVLYATNLGWPEIADPAQELGMADLRIVVNDAEAAALGESVLRSGASPSRDLLYISLGTGVRRYPSIITNLARLVPYQIEGTAAPSEAKSAAYAGLDYLSRHEGV
jgi:hypothetical protein